MTNAHAMHEILARMPAPYRLAIFDFDGTLADSFALFSEAYDLVATRHGFRALTPEEKHALRSQHARDVMKYVGMPAWKLPIAAAEFIAMMRERRASVQPFPGTTNMLQALRRAGIGVAIVSSNARDNVVGILGEDATATVGHFACGMSMFGKRKHLREALRQGGVEKTAAIYVGDQAADLEAAQAEGIDFGAVAWGYGDVAHLASLGAARTFRSMEELASTLAG